MVDDTFWRSEKIFWIISQYFPARHISHASHLARSQLSTVNSVLPDTILFYTTVTRTCWIFFLISHRHVG